jgi:phosphoheptose isomerase
MAGELLKGFMLKRTLTDEERESFKKAMSPEDAEYITGHLQRGLPAISLVSQTSLYSAYVNDVAADMVFAQQVFTYVKKGDVLFAITTSGTSKNVLSALKTAKALELISILLMGQRNKDIAAPLADLAICVGESETYKIQELHLPVYHALCAAIEAESFDT